MIAYNFVVEVYNWGPNRVDDASLRGLPVRLGVLEAATPRQKSLILSLLILGVFVPFVNVLVWVLTLLLTVFKFYIEFLVCENANKVRDLFQKMILDADLCIDIDMREVAVQYYKIEFDQFIGNPELQDILENIDLRQTGYFTAYRPYVVHWYENLSKRGYTESITLSALLLFSTFCALLFNFFTLLALSN